MKIGTHNNNWIVKKRDIMINPELEIFREANPDDHRDNCSRSHLANYTTTQRNMHITLMNVFLILVNKTFMSY